jgi:hypothetical protein
VRFSVALAPKPQVESFSSVRGNDRAVELIETLRFSGIV